MNHRISSMPAVSISRSTISHRAERSARDALTSLGSMQRAPYPFELGDELLQTLARSSEAAPACPRVLAEETLEFLCKRLGRLFGDVVSGSDHRAANVRRDLLQLRDQVGH